jgi:ABC-type transporter Mla MlaB component
MLRITEIAGTTTSGNATWTLRLEGTLRGEWVTEFRRAWRRIREIAAGASIRLELADIRFVDAAGKVLLAEMHRDGAEIVARNCLTKAIRDEIVAASRLDRQLR